MSEATHIPERKPAIPTSETQESAQFQGTTMAPPPFQLAAAGVVQRREAPADNNDSLNGGVPAAFIEHLMLRENFIDHVYPDSLKIPTAGLGHRMKDHELKKYPMGAKVPMDVLKQWAREDTKWAYEAAQNQVAQLPAAAHNQTFTIALASMCFQSGPYWHTVHKNTWALMKQGKWEAAAIEAADSDWARQTPTRLYDFQAALRALAGGKTPASEGVAGNGATKPIASGTVTGDDVNVRSGPDTTYKAIGQLDTNAPVSIYETRNGWHRIGTGRWIKAEFVKQGAQSQPQPQQTPESQSKPTPNNTNSQTPIGRGSITGTSINVRKGPGLNFEPTGIQLDGPMDIKVYEKKDGWYRIGKDMWVSSQFMTLEGAQAKPVTAPATTAPVTSTPKLENGTVQADFLNVRTGPGTNFSTIGDKIQEGTTISIYEIRNGWLRIGEGRWVSAEHVRYSGSPKSQEQTSDTTKPRTGATHASGLEVASGTDRAATTISASVGYGGANRKADVIKVEQLLQTLGFKMVVNGVADKNTIGAIAAFQKAVLGSNDGRIDPGGRTLKLMNETPTGAFKNTNLNLQQDADAPVFNHPRWTNRSKLMVDGAGQVIPRASYPTMRELIRNLNIIADNLKGTFNCNSGYRSPYYNSTVEGSASQSNHQFGRACDIAASAYTPTQLKAQLLRLMKEGKIHKGGIGLYAWGCHYDIDTYREW